MHTLLDMASSPEYLAPSAEDIDLNIDPAITAMSNGSCSSIPPSAVSYATPDPNSYSEVSFFSSSPPPPAKPIPRSAGTIVVGPTPSSSPLVCIKTAGWAQGYVPARYHN